MNAYSHAILPHSPEQPLDSELYDGLHAAAQGQQFYEELSELSVGDRYLSHASEKAIPLMVVFDDPRSTNSAPRLNQPGSRNEAAILFADLHAGGYRIGPLIHPRCGPCLACWQATQAYFLQEPAPPSEPQETPAHLERFYDQLLHEIGRLTSDASTSRLQLGTTLYYDGESAREKLTIFFKMPNCPVCSIWRHYPTEVLHQ